MAILYSEMKSDYSSKIRFNKLIKYLDYDLIFIDFYKIIRYIKINSIQ